MRWNITVFVASFWFACVSIGVTPVSSIAAEADWFPEIPERPVVLVLDVALDEENGRNAQATLSIPLSESFTSNLSLGHSSIDLQPESLEFAYGSGGLTYQYKGFGIGVDIGVWGDSSVLDTVDYTGRIFYQWEKWQADLSVTYRDIDFSFQLRSPVTDRIVSRAGNLTATAVGGGLVFYPDDHWSFYVNGADHNYNANLRILNFAFALRLLSLQSLTLSSSFPQWYWAAGVNYSTGSRRINLEYTSNQSVFDRLETESVSGALQVPLGGSGDYYLDLRIGSQQTDPFSSVAFGVVSILMFW